MYKIFQRSSISLCAMLFACVGLEANAYEILFTKQSGGTDNIFKIDKNGVLHQITSHSSKDSSPVMSPDRSHIVFTSERVGWWKIWVYDIEKNKFKQLTHSSHAEYAPSWSPDGKHIVFVSERDGNAAIYRMNLFGENLQKLTKNSSENTTPHWANNGKIYYSSKENGTYQIKAMSADGADKTILTTNEGDKLMPQLSSDLSTLLYYSDMDGNYEIYTMQVDGSGNKKITDHPLMDIRAKWSHDGKKIVFERGNKKNDQHVYIMDANGANVQQLTLSYIFHIFPRYT